MQSSSKPILLRHLRELYHLEKSFVSHISRLSAITRFPALKEDIEQQVVDTKAQIEQLEEVFRLYGEEPHALESPLIRTLFEEKLLQIHSTSESQIRDFLILDLLHSIGNIELVYYVQSIIWSKLIGKSEASNLLKKNFGNEIQSSRGLALVSGQMVQSVSDIDLNLQ